MTYFCRALWKRVRTLLFESHLIIKTQIKMFKQIKLGFLAFALIGFLASCQNDNEARDQAVNDAAGNATTTASTPQQPGQLQPNANATTPAPPTGPTTTVQFAEQEYNFGKVKSGEKVQHEYTFKNTGSEPLVISNAKGSCGCTVPEWPKEPIAPGSSGKINVVFDSKGKSGPQTKTVTITANTDPPNTIIYIKGEVEGAANTQQK